MYWLKRILLATLAVVGIFLGLIWFFIGERAHEPDEALIENLREHRDEFERLILMFHEDAPLAIVHPTWMEPPNGVGAQRWDAYKELFAELELDGGIRAASWHGGKCIEFISTAQGFVFHDSIKGYLYRPDNPSPQHLSLDFLSDEPTGHGPSGYRKVDDDWYLFFE